MAKEKPEHSYKMPAFQIEIWPNRVVIKERKIFGWDQNVIPMRKITNVTFNNLTNKISIETDGGKTLNYKIAGFGTPKKIVDAILENL